MANDSRNQISMQEMARKMDDMESKYEKEFSDLKEMLSALLVRTTVPPDPDSQDASSTRNSLASSGT